MNKTFRDHVSIDKLMKNVTRFGILPDQINVTAQQSHGILARAKRKIKDFLRPIYRKICPIHEIRNTKAEVIAVILAQEQKLHASLVQVIREEMAQTIRDELTPIIRKELHHALEIADKKLQK